jgi:alkyl hydroperoxide reductase subunit AhpC
MSAQIPVKSKKNIGRSAPINDEIAASSCVAVYEKGNGGLKFIHLDTSKYKGRYVVLVVMDSNLTDAEATNMLAFNDSLESFRNLDASVIGVATTSNTSLRAWMQNKLRGLKFPVIADKGGDLCHALGVLSPDTHHSPRSLVIIDPEGCLIHVSKYNQHYLPKPKTVINFLEIIRDNEKKSGKLFLKPISDYTATIEASISSSQLSSSESGSSKSSPKPSTKDSSAASVPSSSVTSKKTGSSRSSDQSRTSRDKDLFKIASKSEVKSQIAAAISSKKSDIKSKASSARPSQTSSRKKYFLFRFL